MQKTLEVWKLHHTGARPYLMAPDKPPQPKTRDYHLPPSRFRLSAPLGRQLLACITNDVSLQHSMVLTPQMQKVEHGREARMDDKPIWDCTLPAGQCYQDWLNIMGTHMLIGSSKEGRGAMRFPTGLDQFKRPQTTDSIHNLEDTHRHMPSRTGFPAESLSIQQTLLHQTRATPSSSWARTGKVGL